MFEVQVNVAKYDGPDSPDWKSMRPTGGEPYRFKTYAEAEQAARLMGDAYTLLGKVRIREV